MTGALLTCVAHGAQGTLQALGSIARTDGARGLFRGLGPTARPCTCNPHATNAANLSNKVPEAALGRAVLLVLFLLLKFRLPAAVQPWLPWLPINALKIMASFASWNSISRGHVNMCILV